MSDPYEFQRQLQVLIDVAKRDAEKSLDAKRAVWTEIARLTNDMAMAEQAFFEAFGHLIPARERDPYPLDEPLPRVAQNGAYRQ